jgi:ElaB/YqjD/DUF883 family membrane-anchored ribosome-binding protein
MTRHEVQTDIDALRGDMEKLRGDVAALTRAAIDGAGTAIGESIEEHAVRLRTTLEALETALEEARWAARTRAREGVTALQSRVSGWPLSSVTAAFSVGLLIGWLIRR